ncbi:MAG: hypothetical protein IJ949_01500 [Oscillospiraceae bacterium]|nr:hypothetical protein [Oscillospiraceae bacterium]
MTECIAMAVGVILGGACAIFAQMQNAKCKEQSAKGYPSAEPQDDKENKPQDDAEREKLQKQWENFINYGGSADGQVEVEN